jgi:hypothetical protein
MRTDLQREGLKGTLPIFYVFLARGGKTITDITFVTLDKSGKPHSAAPNEQSKTFTPGVRITFTGGPDASPQTLYYFTTDLSNEGIRQQPGFLKFCQARGTGGSLLKSSSYLMFENGFSRVRDFLLTHSKAIVQDDSGIPIAAFDPAKWLLRFFGSYAGPIDLFKQYYQPQLQGLYQQSNPAPPSRIAALSPQQSIPVVATRRGPSAAPSRAAASRAHARRAITPPRNHTPFLTRCHLQSMMRPPISRVSKADAHRSPRNSNSPLQKPLKSTVNNFTQMLDRLPQMYGWVF